MIIHRGVGDWGAESTNEQPRSKLRGIKDLNKPVKERELASVYLVICPALFLNIFTDHFFIAVLPYGVHIVTARPKPTTPEHFLHLRVGPKYLSDSDALDDLHDRLR